MGYINLTGWDILIGKGRRSPAVSRRADRGLLYISIYPRSNTYSNTYLLRIPEVDTTETAHVSGFDSSHRPDQNPRHHTGLDP